MIRIFLIVALSSALGAQAFAATQKAQTSDTVLVAVSTKDKADKSSTGGSAYHYATKTGVGPYNDSR